MLLLYMSSNQNIGLFDEPCRSKNIVVKQLKGEFSLNRFVIQDMSNLNCCQYFAVDLSCLKDNDEYIINAIVGIKSMYEIRIIILAIGYECGNALLGRLFAEGIYNIITAEKTAEQQSDIVKCITDGMQYKDAFRYRLNNTPVKGTSKVIIKKQSIKQTISVGVCGALHRIGTTTQALHMTKFLNENGYSACYIEDNGHGHIETMKGFYNVEINDDKSIKYDGIDIYTEFDASGILNGGYDFLVYDSGLYEEINHQQFITKDIKIVCVGSNSWEAPCIIPIFKNIGDYSDIYFIFNFTPLELQGEIKKLMGKFKDKSYFAAYTPSLIDGITNRSIYNVIFKDYIHAKTEKKRRFKGLFERIRK